MPRISKPYVERRLQDGTVVKEKTVSSDWTHHEYYEHEPTDGEWQVLKTGSGNYSIMQRIGLAGVALQWSVKVSGVESWHEAKQIAERLIEESER